MEKPTENTALKSSEQTIYETLNLSDEEESTSEIEIKTHTWRFFPHEPLTKAKKGAAVAASAVLGLLSAAIVIGMKYAVDDEGLNKHESAYPTIAAFGMFGLGLGFLSFWQLTSGKTIVNHTTNTGENALSFTNGGESNSMEMTKRRGRRHLIIVDDITPPRKKESDAQSHSSFNLGLTRSGSDS